MSKATKKPIVAESVPTPSRGRTTMVYVGEIDDTRRSAVMRPPSRPAYALPTLADYRLKPRGELPGESWLECCARESGYTTAFRAARAYRLFTPLTPCELMGYADGLRVRERRAGK